MSFVQIDAEAGILDCTGVVSKVIELKLNLKVQFFHLRNCCCKLALESGAIRARVRQNEIQRS